MFDFRSHSLTTLASRNRLSLVGSTARRLLLLFVLLTSAAPIAAQRGAPLAFSGRVLDAETGEPLEMATVLIGELGQWAITDRNGAFTIGGLRRGDYEYEARILGYQKQTGKAIVRASEKPVTIRLKPMDLSLDEVVVTAEEQKMGSASRIDETAIQHIQPKSLEDMFQLVPGNVTKNPNLNDVGQASIREISGDGNNALGTSVVVDGAPLSNDANMQLMSTSKPTASLNNQSTAGRGVDLRSISPDNIESVEVVRGIPSVEHGNLTSGVVIVKTRSGVTPWEAKFKADPFSKMAYVGKGFLINDRWGAVNLSADYSQSYADIRKRYNGYDRITASLGYSNTFLKNSTPLTFNLRLAYFRNVNSAKSDPQLTEKERIKNENSGVRFNLEGNWSLNKSWISNLAYSFMTNYSYQRDFRKERILLASGITPIGNATQNGEYETFFLNQSYYSNYVIEGKPLDLFLQLKANKLIQFTSESFMNVKLGAEWRYNDNNGAGLVFDPHYPPQVQSNQTVRPRAFSDIPAMNQFAVFLEDKVQFPLGSTKMTLQGGIRVTDLLIDASAKRDNMVIVEPRINFEYNILNRRNNNLFDDLSIVGGYGVSSKAPTLLQLYPDKAYFDETSYALMFADDPQGALGKSTAVMTTKVIDDTSNPNLKPTYSYKAEIGLAGRIQKVRGMVTFFYERHENEYAYNSMPVVMPFRRFSTPDGIDNVSYENGTLYYEQNGTRLPATVRNDTSFYNYRMPMNGMQTKKHGIEYSLSLGQIPALRTSLVVDGAWLHVKRRSTQPSYSPLGIAYEGGKYPYMPVLPAGSGTVEERVNTNFRFITHIPQLRMVFSTTVQVIWAENYRAIYEDGSGNNLYYKAVDPQSGNNKEIYFVNPTGFLDRQGNYTAWNPSFTAQAKYRWMLSRFTNSNAFGTERYPTTVLLNFRLTKEFGKILEVSFMANNFLKMYKTYKYRTMAGYRDLTTPLYFGAEIKVKI